MAPGADPPRNSTGPLLLFVRYGLPAVAVLAGIIVMSMGSDADVEGGAGIAGAGIAIYAINWLYRTAVSGDVERDREEEARRYLDEHGHWPDEKQR